MKGIGKYFWAVYMLFFAVPFPMIIYYNTSYRMPGSSGTAPWLALTFLALSAALWIFLLRGWFRGWIAKVFTAKQNIERLLQHGVRKEARVVACKRGPTAGDGTVPTELTVAFPNFAGTEIREQLALRDTQPELRRYEVGQTAGLLIDEELKAVPHLTLEGAKPAISKARIIVLSGLWLLIAGLVAGYYFFSYELENAGTGWRFLKFSHPLVLCPFILAVARFGLSRLLRLFGGPPANALQLKYYGIRTDATIASAEQTGTYINKQPQVRFRLQYDDYSGRNHTATLKRVVPLMDLAAVRQGSVPVFYLKDHPEQVAFASDLEA